jgi:hypothetical protein
MAHQLLRDGPNFLLDWDHQLLASVLLARQRAGDRQVAKEATRAQSVTSGAASVLEPGWVLEPGAPLADLAATRRSDPSGLTVLVMNGASLPKDGSAQADAWVQAALNGGERGGRRALQEVAAARHVGAVALARARLGVHLGVDSGASTHPGPTSGAAPPAARPRAAGN